jgi:hypothetical protein
MVAAAWAVVLALACRSISASRGFLLGDPRRPPLLARPSLSGGQLCILFRTARLVPGRYNLRLDLRDGRPFAGINTTGHLGDDRFRRRARRESSDVSRMRARDAP